VTSSSSRSAEKAAALYDQRYAERYRAHDDTLTDSGPYLGFVKWLQRVCDQFSGPIDALELGCGTGRYFSALRNVRTLVGLDASADMLAMARTPYRADAITAERITLIHGDLFTQPLDEGAFDLVYSIGVLAEHAPFNEAVAMRVQQLLKPGGRFAFSTVHPDSPSITKTAGRSLGRAIALLPGPFKRPMRERLLSGGMYADETRIEELLKPAFQIESIERFISEAHLHCLCVAKKVGAR
jgi:SAM-dependent methyltransferase